MMKFSIESLSLGNDVECIRAARKVEQGVEQEQRDNRVGIGERRWKGIYWSIYKGTFHVIVLP